jgi:hypothetical protein
MDTTIRNIDERIYRELKAKAALEGKTVGEALNEAIHAWLAGAHPLSRTGTLRDLQPQSWRRGDKRVSEQIDRIVYGVRS